MTDHIIFPNIGGLELNPPDGIHISESFTLYFYGMIIALGLVLAVVYALRRCNQFGFRQDDILDGVLWIVPVSVICARLYYVFAQWDYYGSNLKEIINIRGGGLAIYGAVIGAAVCVILHCKIKKINLPALLDLVALGFLIGQAVGRWGNFINREAFGSYSDGLFAMRVAEMNLTVPQDASAKFLEQVEVLRQNAIAGGYEGYIQVHPTFLYESMWNLVGFVALHFLSKKRQYDGQIALGYVAWYGLGRAIIEGLRMDSLYWGSFRASQLLAAVSCFAAVVVLVVMAFKKHRKENLFVNRVRICREMQEAVEAFEKEGTDPEDTTDTELNL